MVVPTAENSTRILRDATQSERRDVSAGKKPLLPAPKKIYEYLNRHVVGQHQAKKALSVCVYNHYKRIRNNVNNKRQHTPAASLDYSATDDLLSAREFFTAGPMFSGSVSPVSSSFGQSPSADEHADEQPSQNPPTRGGEVLDDAGHEILLEKSNVLLLGPTGSGKTLLAETIARCLDVPFAICDCTTLTQAGYVGEDVESVIVKLVQDAGFSVEKAEQGTVGACNDFRCRISSTCDLLVRRGRSSQPQP